jgi:hypothetical protein
MERSSLAIILRWMAARPCEQGNGIGGTAAPIISFPREGVPIALRSAGG